MSCLRERFEEAEYRNLAKEACHAAESQGRLAYQEKCPVRTDFQRDRDRIIHSNSFRRLKEKTQVFLAPEGDHYRTRMTHTLEVSQIARTVARALALNEDLTESLANLAVYYYKAKGVPAKNISELRRWDSSKNRPNRG